MFKDTVISAGTKKREFIILVCCFAAAFLLNIIAIIIHGSPARELVTQLHVVALVALFLYALAAILRILYYLLSRLWLRKRK